MSRQEADREDLFEEATACRIRGELILDGRKVFVGFRSLGQPSFYFGADPVYQFDELFRLRRAYHSGDLYRSEGTTLSRLRRHRSDNASILSRQDLNTNELNEFRTEMEIWFRGLLEALSRGLVTAGRTTEPADEFLTRVETTSRQVLEKMDQLSPAIAAR
ncbi:hypothetical protein [Rubinisphaera margarita]|uniref:hypothetical protein n=1 Tax=Rubinisphaera margarita TaxID=2909586 RepID=UPI001EE7FDD4|nr:hypothetical protein [Rubinisphaera margarita]MCG6157034.1 hypothetical protein [Rubinisphaera margarita]